MQRGQWAPAPVKATPRITVPVQLEGAGSRWNIRRDTGGGTEQAVGSRENVSQSGRELCMFKGKMDIWTQFINFLVPNVLEYLLFCKNSLYYLIFFMYFQVKISEELFVFVH